MISLTKLCLSSSILLPMCLFNCRSVFLTAWFFVSVEFVYVYGCLSVWMVVCVCDRLSAYVSGLVCVLFCIGLLCAYISMYPFGLMSTCVFACVYVCMSVRFPIGLYMWAFVCGRRSCSNAVPELNLHLTSIEG